MTISFFRAKTQEITLPDGRVLAFGVYGAAKDEPPGAAAPDTPVVIYFHGFPGSHDEAFMVHEAALAQGMQVVALTRPGFAASDPQPSRKITDWPRDVLAFADHFSIARFAIMAVSGGGPYSLACLAALPADRLAGVALCCGMYPTALGCAGMRIPSRVMLTISPWVPSLVAMLMGATLSKAARDEDPDVFEKTLDGDLSTMPPSDHEILVDNYRGCKQALVSSTREAVKPGGQATAQEFALFGSHWGFELQDIEFSKGKLVMWHGTEDTNVPFHMAKKASELMPNAELRVLEGKGHLGIVLSADEIAATLRGMLDRKGDGDGDGDVERERA